MPERLSTLPEARAVGRVKRLTVRARMTLTFAGLFTGAGLVLVLLVYAFMRYVPTYAIQADVSQAGFRSTDATVTTSDGTAVAPSVVGLQLTDQSDILNTLLGVSIIILIALAAVSAAAGWLLAGRMLRPLQEINLAAQRAATGSFDHRVALAGPRDEITDLSDTFDHMLERLGRSFQAHQRFAANASHELRTPLATTQAMLDVAARETERTPARTAELLGRLRMTNRRSIDTVEAILDLADLGNSELRVGPVRLGPLVDEVLDGAGPAMRERDLTLTTEVRDLVVQGDRALLVQLCGNLVQNAIRHNVDGGFLRMSVRRTGGPNGGAALLQVENSGAPVAAETLARLTEPFYRGSGRVEVGTDRSRGLGLAIVDSIVEAHGAQLRLAARPSGGLLVSVEFGERAAAAAVDGRLARSPMLGA